MSIPYKIKENQNENNRPFAAYDHMVQNLPCSVEGKLRTGTSKTKQLKSLKPKFSSFWIS